MLVNRSFKILAVLALSLSTAIAAPTLIIDDPDTAGVDVIQSGLATNFTSLSFGDWNFQSTTGTRSGNAANFQLILNNISLISTAPTRLVIAWVDSFDSLTLTAPVINYLANAAGSSPLGTLNYLLEFTDTAVTTPLNTANTTFSAGTIFGGSTQTLANSGVITGAALTNNFGPAGVLAPSSPYSLALVALVEATAGGQTFTFDFSATGVPEPGFYGLLALGLSGLFFFGFRKRNATNDLAE